MVRERMRDRCGLVSANVGKPKWDLNKAHVASLIDQTPKMSSSTKRMWFGCQIKFEQSQNEISKLYTTTGIYNAFIAFINKSSLCVQNYSCFYFPFYWKRGLDPHSNASLEQGLPKMSPTWGAGLPKHRPERLFEFERILFFPTTFNDVSKGWICWRAMGTDFTQVINHAILSAVHQVGWVWMKDGECVVDIKTQDHGGIEHEKVVLFHLMTCACLLICKNFLFFDERLRSVQRERNTVIEEWKACQFVAMPSLNDGPNARAPKKRAEKSSWQTVFVCQIQLVRIAILDFPCSAGYWCNPELLPGRGAVFN